MISFRPEFGPDRILALVVVGWLVDTQLWTIASFVGLSRCLVGLAITFFSAPPCQVNVIPEAAGVDVDEDMIRGLLL